MTPPPEEFKEFERRILQAAAAALQDRATGTGLDLPTSIADRVGGEKPDTVELILRDLADRGYLEVDPPDSATQRPPRERVPVIGLTPAGRAAAGL